MVAAAAVPVSRCIDGVHDPVPAAPARIRRTLRTTFAQWGLSLDTTENALLVVEEMVANAVDHARTPFRLTVDHTGAALHVTVWDGDPGTLHLRPFSTRAARGRGLQMIDALTSRWGWDRTAGGKTVWAVLPT
jgi:anti-sigma regulatory factor (Ser/Thr protein kinase)